MNPRLIGVAGPLEGSMCVLPEGEVSIGRDQLWAADGSLSRRHCVVRREGAKCSVRDVGEPERDACERRAGGRTAIGARRPIVSGFVVADVLE